MGLCSSKGLDASMFHTTYSEYKGAGILFTEGPVALAGIQKYGRVCKGATAVLSGLGGRRESSDIDWLHTAWREVIEELFGVDKVPVALVNDLRIHLPLRFPASCTGGYVLVRFGFDELTRALTICSNYRIVSELYKTMPLTVSDLLLKRSPSASAEIGTLSLIPVSHRVTIAEEFFGDLSTH